MIIDEYSESDYDASNLEDETNALRFHHKAFQHVIQKYGLHEEDKAERLSAFLTNVNAGDDGGMGITAKMVEDEFGINEGDAKTFLSWIQIGTKFKQENLGNTAEELKKLHLDKQRAARDAATRGLTDGSGAGGGAK